MPTNPSQADTIDWIATAPLRDAAPIHRLMFFRLFCQYASRRIHTVLITFSAVLFTLHFFHLSADFPNSSRWMDWSKYTDEGWYGDAAIRYYQLGHWFLPGDFNPAVALPIWPLLEAILFRFTGVSLVAERGFTVAIFGASLIAAWFLIARSQPTSPNPSLAGSVAILLLAANPFCFVFTRLGILEPPLIFFMLLALLVAQSTCAAATLGETLRFNLFPILALGLLLPTLILTKTTGLFLVPAIFWMLFASIGYRFRTFLWLATPVAAIATSLWGAYFFLIVRPHYLADYRYLFSANAYTGINRNNWLSVIYYAIHGAAWMGRPIYLLAIAAIVFAISIAFFNVRRFRDSPLIPTLILWAGGYTAFLAYHNNLQPRYYLVIAIPLTLLVPVTFQQILFPLLESAVPQAIALSLAAFAVCLIVAIDARQIVSYVRHPQYTYVRAATGITQYIERQHRADPSHSMLLLSISGSDLSLMTGIHSICDDFGTLELADRVRLYQPGWYLSWNLIEDDKMDSLDPQDRVTRVATFPAMDDQDRNQLILYRLDPETLPPGERRGGKGRRARNRNGQQPSSVQLGH
jgi:hypothetical protein